MTRSDIKSLVKGLEKKLEQDSDLTDLLDNIDKIAAAVGGLDDDAPAIRVPYVNASPVTTGAWK